MKTLNKISTKQYLLLKTILSALLFSFSFLFINNLGFLIIPAFILLFDIVNNNYRIGRLVLLSFFWGLIAFGLHFIWLYELLLNKSGATLFLATGLYFFIIIYSGLLTTIYFFILNKLFDISNLIINKIIVFITVTFSFFYFIDKNYLFFLGKESGYPFLNPLIPLAKYKWFLLIYSFIFSPNQTTNKLQEKFLKENKIIYLKPLVKSYDNNYNATTMGQIIYQQLANLNLEKYLYKYKNIILLSPETYFPYSLNKNKKIVKLWSTILPESSYFFVGSQREKTNKQNKLKIYQTVFLLESGRIIDFYDKKHRALFAEFIPNIFKNSKWSSSLFLNGKVKFTAGCQNKTFKITQEFTIIPKICSEFFCRVDLNIKEDVSFLFLFVNDSWFMNYFKNMMQNLAYLISCELNLIVFYNNHKDLCVIKL
ncbi:MAG: hypothetical protein ABIF12_00530 [bacterium]